MVYTGIVLLDVEQPMLLKQKRKQELNLFWQLLFALSRGFSPPAKRERIFKVTRHPWPECLILKSYQSPALPYCFNSRSIFLFASLLEITALLSYCLFPRTTAISILIRRPLLYTFKGTKVKPFCFIFPIKKRFHYREAVVFWIFPRRNPSADFLADRARWKRQSNTVRRYGR